MRRLRVVARLQCRWLMRVTMLPPPPSFRIAAWARLNAIWFGVVDVLVRRLGPAVRAVRGEPKREIHRTVRSTIAPS